MVKTINTEAELQGFCVQLRGQGEYTGTAAHYVETRRREIQIAKGRHQ